jgi:hypothetical protein
MCLEVEGLRLVLREYLMDTEHTWLPWFCFSIVTGPFIDHIEEFDTKVFTFRYITTRWVHYQTLRVELIEHEIPFIELQLLVHANELLYHGLYACR